MADSHAIQISSTAGGAESEEKASEAHVANIEHSQASHGEPRQEQSDIEDGENVTLGWRSWLVVLITLWG